MILEFIKENWAIITVAILPLAEVIVRLTPTKKDDTALDFFKKIMDVFIPNKKAGGGTHKK